MVGTGVAAAETVGCCLPAVKSLTQNPLTQLHYDVYLEYVSLYKLNFQSKQTTESHQFHHTKETQSSALLAYHGDPCHWYSSISRPLCRLCGLCLCGSLDR